MGACNKLMVVKGIMSRRRGRLSWGYTVEDLIKARFIFPQK